MDPTDRYSALVICTFKQCDIELVVRHVDSSLQLYERVGTIWRYSQYRKLSDYDALMEAAINLVQSSVSITLG
jgi:hypothetical protein